MSSSINKNVNVERRTWDKETYEARARSRAAAEEDGGASAAPAVAGDAAASGDATNDAVAAIKNDIDPTEEKEEFLPANQGRAGPMGSQRAFLKSRSRKVDLEGKLGSTEIIDPAAASATKSNLGDDDAAPLTPSSGVTKCSDGVGWHCRVCDCFLKDSLTYLDHINGRKHQRFLGYTMRVEKSTTEEVSGVLKGLADKKREIAGSGIATSAAVDFEDVVRKKDEDALRRKADRARRREERKRREREEKNGGSGITQPLNVVREAETNNAEEEKVVAEGENPAGEEEEEEEEEPAMDPALAAMMGFSGFGGSRK